MQYRAAAFAIATSVFAGGLYLRFQYDPPLPPRPPRPAASDLAAFRALDYSENVYRARIERDAAAAGVAPDSLTGVFRYESLAPGRVLTAGGPPLEAGSLALSLRTGRVTTEIQRGSFTSDHLILRIENRGDAFLAYRVDGRLPVTPSACVEKGEISHNAIALAPHEVVERTECARGGINSLTVERVETMELPPLAYHYVSRLFPAHIGLDPRATRGHVVPEGSACTDIPEQAIRRGMEKGEVSWRDVIDFYARHNCASYIFPVGYRAFTRPEERPLPAGAEGRKETP